MAEYLSKKPVKLFAQQENRKKILQTETSSKFDRSVSGSMLPSQSYGRNAKNRSSTMFDKLFRHSPSKYTNRVSKHPYKRRNRMNEIERCTNIQQRDQYRLLIAQYSNKSLAETASIFCKPTPISKAQQSSKRPEKTPFIDLSGTPTPPNGEVIPKTTVHPLTLQSSLHYKTSTSTSRTPMKSLPVPLLQSRFESKMSSEATVKTPLSKHPPATSMQTPKASNNSPIDWFSPKSPYLAKNFVTDLVNTYSRRERERKRILAEEETRARLLHEKRQIKEELLAQLLEERLKVTPKEPDVVEELSEEVESKVDDALVPFPPHQMLVEAFNISITREHMATLSGLNWLNDEVINFYMELIVERSKKIDNLPTAHAMNTFFYPKLTKQGYKSVRRWTKKVDIFSKSLVLFPIHLGVHWTLAVADFRCKELRYYDSMGGSNTECLSTLRDYLASEHLDKKKNSYVVTDWKTISSSPQEIPQQMNGSDCGVFTCTFAEFISRDSPLNFTQSNMPLLRRTMVWEILNRTLTR